MTYRTGRKASTALPGLIALVLFALLASAGAGECRAEETNATAASKGTGYTVVFQGVEGDLRDLLQQISVAAGKSDEPFVSSGLIARRIEDDKKLFQTALNSKGYMDSSVKADLNTSVKPPVLTYTVDTGPPFILEGISYEVNGAVEGMTLPDAQALGLDVGARFDAVTVVAVSRKVQTQLADNGYPFPKVAKPRILADFQAHTVRAVYTVTPGQKADFGATEISGLTTVDEEFVRAYIPWKEGELFDRTEFDTYYDRLSQLNLFSTIRIDPDTKLDDSGRVPIKVQLTERKQRTIRAGLGYSSDKGPQAHVGWEHRNLLGGGEKLKASIRASGVESEAGLAYNSPRFLGRELSFDLDGKYVKSDTEAYKANTFETGFLISKEVVDHLSMGGGLRYRHGDIIEDESRPFDNNRLYDLLSVVLKASWDNRDSVLDPTSGHNIDLRVEPFFPVGNTEGASSEFVQTVLSATSYLKLLDSPRLVLAGRGAAGASWGVTSDDLPATLRFYPGGGGSVRGYGYQMAGPVSGSTPQGGAAFLEFSAEARAMLTEKFGIVPFLDGGYAYEDPFDINGDMLFGAGLGIRYHTSFGPLRADIAVPLKRRKDVDDPFQFYISIGQAF
ncbi:autotransporter assembly complex protein TamA [Oceanidesulfovibrio marinus]|uniref:Autotransporter secretion outer membrane protein TamA n=1 Tax=Oceanidesulfovibrio marinus TaxID=370038 RepID=A0ABX6NHN7_9BACT|nr:BamA/TamA family outer membrane protein [Oceanidesulfovibrio marinus]QJT10142.1 hypothetical protein E8L03_14910 [Oceanidesulfovibrio marinus]